MAPLYPRTTIGPYTGTASYFDAAGELCTRERAVRVRIVCDDGRVAWFEVTAL